MDRRRAGEMPSQRPPSSISPHPPPIFLIFAVFLSDSFRRNGGAVRLRLERYSARACPAACGGGAAPWHALSLGFPLHCLHLDAGAQYAAQLLQTNSSLQQLSLSCNSISLTGALALLKYVAALDGTRGTRGREGQPLEAGSGISGGRVAGFGRGRALWRSWDRFLRWGSASCGFGYHKAFCIDALRAPPRGGRPKGVAAPDWKVGQ